MKVLLFDVDGTLVRAGGAGFAEWGELAASGPDHLARDFRGLRRWLSWFQLS